MRYNSPNVQLVHFEFDDHHIQMIVCLLSVNGSVPKSMSYLGFDQYALVDQVLSRGYVVHHLLRNHLKYWYVDYLVLNQIMQLKKVNLATAA